MHPGTPCHFRGDGCCTIYDNRPQNPCRSFVCGWLQTGSPFPEEYRPDRLGVLIVRTQWRNAPAYILRAAGRDPDESLLDWMRAYSRATGYPFFYEERGERLGYGPAEFLAEMSRTFERAGRQT